MHAQSKWHAGCKTGKYIIILCFSHKNVYTKEILVGKVSQTGTPCNLFFCSGGSRGGARGPCPPPPLIFRPFWGPKGRKIFFWDRTPLYLGVWTTGPPPYLKVWISTFQRSLSSSWAYSTKPGRDWISNLQNDKNLMDRINGLTCFIPIQMREKDVVGVVTLIDLAPVVEKVDSAIHRINLYSLDSTIGFPNYPLDGDLSGG